MTGASTVLPGLWATVVMAWAWRHRPAPERMRALVASAGGDGRRPTVERLGAVIRRAAGRPADRRADRHVGWTAAAVALALLVSPGAACGVVAISIVWTRAAAARRDRRLDDTIRSSVPDAIDLFALAASAGHPVRRSVELVAARADGPVGVELQAAVGRIAHGDRTADALEGVAGRLGEPVRPLITVLCASERYGTALVPALERLAIDARNDRRRRAEEAARRVPVKLLFPLVLCTLPAFALLTVVPLVFGAFESLRL